MRRRRGWWARRVRRCRSSRWEEEGHGLVVGERRDGRARSSSVGRLTGGGAASSAPVIAPTSCSTVASAPRNWATRRPRRSTWMLSDTSSTSGMLWLISTTATPWSATRRTSSSTLPVWRTPRAAVGSSMKITLLAHITERQIATLCFWPPDSAPTGASRSFTSVPMRVNASPACSRIALRSSTPRRPRIPGLSSSRPANVFSAGPSSGARARSWYTVSIPRSRARVGEPSSTSSPSSRIVPRSSPTAPDRILTSVLLPAPLSPMSAVTSPASASKSTSRSTSTCP